MAATDLKFDFPPSLTISSKIFPVKKNSNPSHFVPKLVEELLTPNTPPVLLHAPAGASTRLVSIVEAVKRISAPRAVYQWSTVSGRCNPDDLSKRTSYLAILLSSTPFPAETTCGSQQSSADEALPPLPIVVPRAPVTRVEFDRPDLPRNTSKDAKLSSGVGSLFPDAMDQNRGPKRPFQAKASDDNPFIRPKKRLEGKKGGGKGK